MKRLAVLLAILSLLVPFTLAAQTVLVNDAFSSMGSWQAAYGDWLVNSGALVQNDVKAGMAKANRPASQSGITEYDFTVKYVNGGFTSQSDLQKGIYHAGFGIHIGVKNPSMKKSWGNGQSYLLWLNLDTRPETMAKSPEHYGFRAQVYKSESNSKMTLLSQYNIQIPASWLKTEYLGYTIPVKIVVDSKTGLVKVYDPTLANYVYKFYIDGDLTGSYVAFRTNSMAVKFDDFKMVKF